MALGLPASGEAKAHIKYDARAGRFSRMDNKEATDITQSFAAIMDLAQIEVGWARFAANAAPEFVMARVGAPLPARPTQDHKRAFRMMLKLGKTCGGDVREFASAAGCVIQALDELHDAYSAAPQAAQGMLPVVTLSGSVPVKTTTPNGTTTNYKPQLTITGWQPRPADLPLSGDAPPAKAAPVAAPAAAPKPQPAMADTEF